MDRLWGEQRGQQALSSNHLLALDGLKSPVSRLSVLIQVTRAQGQSGLLQVVAFVDPQWIPRLIMYVCPSPSLREMPVRRESRDFKGKLVRR